MNKAILTSFTILCLLSTLFLMGGRISVQAGTDIIYVPTDYPTIQEAINHANPGDTIFVHKRTYYEHVIVNKSVSLVGEDRDSTIVDGNETGRVISITANNVSIKGFTINGSGMGPYDSGISVDNFSGNNIVSGNTMTNNYHGIGLYSSSNNIVSGNTMTNNYHGIGLYSSSNNIVSGNTMTNNQDGMYLALYSRNNTIYHNNFNNTDQVLSDSTNVWHNGHEGNYWSDYNGTDVYSGPFRNETGSDGIGDTPYVIDENNQDNYPLMGMFSDFNVTLEKETYHVTTICNSTISEFRFEIGQETGNKIIRFNAAGKNSTAGFCRVTIPTELMNYPYIILVGLEEIVPTLLDVSNETHVYLYFAYVYSSHTITIISSKTLHLYNELLNEHMKLRIDLYNLNGTYYDLLNNYSILLDNYSILLNNYSILLDNYSILLNNYSQLQKSYRELNNSHKEHLLDYSKNVQNTRTLMHISTATTAIFIITTVYLSKCAHAGKNKCSKTKNRR